MAHRLVLDRAMSELTSREQQVLAPRFIADRGEAETAKTLNLGVGAVKRYCADARRRLAASLLTANA